MIVEKKDQNGDIFRFLIYFWHLNAPEASLKEGYINYRSELIRFNFFQNKQKNSEAGNNSFDIMFVCHFHPNSNPTKKHVIYLLVYGLCQINFNYI